MAAVDKFNVCFCPLANVTVTGLPVGICAIRPPVKFDAGGEIVTGLTNVFRRGSTVALDVHLVAVTTGALTVVTVLVCLSGALTVVIIGAGLFVVVFVIVDVLLNLLAISNTSFFFCFINSSSFGMVAKRPLERIEC